MATITDTSIANSALRKLGKERISSIDEATPLARVIKESFEVQVLRVLENHPWRFAIRRAVVHALVLSEADTLLYDGCRAYQLPDNCARVLRVDSNPTDFVDNVVIEGRNMIYDGGDAERIAYILGDAPRDLWPATFAEAVAYRIAIENCEAITKSRAKMQQVQAGYDEAIRDAKRNQAIERRFDPGTPDAFELARL